MTVLRVTKPTTQLYGMPIIIFTGFQTVIRTAPHPHAVRVKAPKSVTACEGPVKQPVFTSCNYPKIRCERDAWDSGK